MSLRIELPWPNRDLSPNRARNVHWARKAKLTKEYRYTAWIYTANRVKVKDRLAIRELPEIAMTVTFCPPDNRRRDRTNMEASMKAGFDGIADALGVDDGRFAPAYRKGEPVKGGLVIVEVGT